MSDDTSKETVESEKADNGEHNPASKADAEKAGREIEELEKEADPGPEGH